MLMTTKKTISLNKAVSHEIRQLVLFDSSLKCFEVTRAYARLFVAKAVLGIALFLFAGMAEAADKTPLTLIEAIRQAVDKNLELKAELYNPAMQEALLQQSRSIYNPVLGLSTSVNEKTNYSLLGNNNKLWSRSVQANAGISQMLPTGGTVALDFENSRYFADQVSAATGVKSYWDSSLGLSLSQPLLKNFGRQATELNIDIARLGKEAAVEKLQNRLMNLVAQVRTAYFRLYSLQEEQDVVQVSLELAQRILTETRARVEAGILPAMEILNAQYGVAAREKELIDAERAVSDQSDVLKQLIQLNVIPELEALDKPSTSASETDEQAEVEYALAHRPELKELQRNREAVELQTRVAGINTMPDLSFNAKAATSGLGDSYSRDLDRLGSGNYPVWGVGLAFSYPLGNDAAKNEYRRQRLKNEQMLLQIRNQQELIINEVRAAIRAVKANYKLLEVSQRGRQFAEERMQAFERKVEVGLSTTKDLLDVEQELATAKQDQIRAQVAYDNALTALWLATGAILDKQQIRITGLDAEKLYKDIR